MTDAVDHRHCKLALYADDAKLYKSIESEEDCLELNGNWWKSKYGVKYGAWILIVRNAKSWGSPKKLACAASNMHWEKQS